MSLHLFVHILISLLEVHIYIYIYSYFLRVFPYSEITMSKGKSFCYILPYCSPD